ncbi:MAG: DUF2933 domain-containing protein [Rhizobiales bacterium]|jgi:hypothetical protein|nr:DUF2933 domain-containing protein [Hyphomicrobiales bacterium]
MEWFSQNWVWVLLFFGFIAMHMFGHGGHGSHGGHGGGRNDPKPGKDDVQGTSKQSGHQH